jgi:hypothetical protein
MIYKTSQLCVATDGSRSTGGDVWDTLAVMGGEDPVHHSRYCYSSLGEHIDALFSSSENNSSNISITSADRPLKRPPLARGRIFGHRSSSGRHQRSRQLPKKPWQLPRAKTRPRRPHKILVWIPPHTKIIMSLCHSFTIFSTHVFNSFFFFSCCSLYGSNV